jgi:hypothetical protein
MGYDGIEPQSDEDFERITENQNKVIYAQLPCFRLKELIINKGLKNKGKPMQCQFRKRPTELNTFCREAQITTEILRRIKMRKILANSFYGHGGILKND